MLSFNSNSFIIIICFFLFSCTLDDKHVSPQLKLIKKEETKKKTNKKDNRNFRILIGNGLSNDFSIIEKSNNERKITLNKRMDPANKNGKFICEAINQIKEFNDYLYIVCSLSNEIQIYEKNSLKLIRIISTGNGTNPMEIIFLNSTKAYISSYLKNKVIIINPSVEKLPHNKRILGEIELDQNKSDRLIPRPSGMLIVNDKLYVANQNEFYPLMQGPSGYVSVINTKNDTIEKEIESSNKGTISLSLSQNKELIYFVNTGTYQGKYLGDGSVDIYSIDQDKIIDEIKIDDGAPFQMIIKDSNAYFSNGKDGRLIHLDLDTKKVLNLYEVTCSKEKFNYLSSIILKESILYLTEYNSNCYLEFDINKKEVIFSAFIGRGPDTIIVQTLDN